MTIPKYKIPITKPDLGDDEIFAVSNVIRSGWIMQGNCVSEFERAFAEYVGAKTAIAVSSGTAALHLALLAAGVKQGKTVICPSYSFIATANVIRLCGAEPIFVDIDPETYNIEPKLLASVSQPNTCAILAVHQVGLPANIEEINLFAKEHNLVVIEDAACAIGSEYNQEKIGKPHSLAAGFSFHPRKLLTTGDGGIVTTNDLDFAKQVRCLRQHGIDNPKEGYQVVGFNYRLTDLQAAIGLEQIKKLPLFLSHRRSQAKRYNQAFSRCPLLGIPKEFPNMLSNFQSYQMRLLPNDKITRDELLKGLIEAGIFAQAGIQPIHKQVIYKEFNQLSLIETEKAAQQVVMLPLYYSLSESEQNYIIETTLNLINKH
ncbi:MAG: DegT/DnrJ/EryC1/StrS family aminotransferase [Acidobacteria bacterium]|nr:DegT/DnrJ/EryC1/StrS family aminotransferase [Acidobacteriota bacterium]